MSLTPMRNLKMNIFVKILILRYHIVRVTLSKPPLVSTYFNKLIDVKNESRNFGLYENFLSSYCSMLCIRRQVVARVGIFSLAIVVSMAAFSISCLGKKCYFYLQNSTPALKVISFICEFSFASHNQFTPTYTI